MAINNFLHELSMRMFRGFKNEWDHTHNGKFLLNNQILNFNFYDLLVFVVSHIPQSKFKYLKVNHQGILMSEMTIIVRNVIKFTVEIINYLIFLIHSK